jgi:hypothetical protein
MFMAVLILIISTALFFFYLQVVCEKVLRRPFEQEYYRAIVHANRLEFPAIRKAIEDFNAPVDYARVRMTLKCDFLALTYLLRNASNVRQRLTREERLLVWYFRGTLGLLSLRHWLRLGEQSVVLRLTAILQYFANVIGQRVSLVRFGNMTASDYLLSL